MTDDAFIRQLRDKAAQGEPLTAAEQAELFAWYVRQDQEAAAVSALPPRPPSPLEALGKEMKNASARLQAAAQQLQVKADEYEDLSRDAAALSEQLPKPKTPKDL